MFLIAYDLLWKVAQPMLRRHKRLRDGFEQRLVPPEWPFAPFPATPDLAQLSPLIPTNLLGAELTTSNAQKNLSSADSSSCIWLQAASGGEAKLVRSLVLALQNMPDLAPMTLICTSCTRQGLDELIALSQDIQAPLKIVPQYFPLDSPRLMLRAIRQISPALVVLLETELWPGLLAAAQKTSTPVLILNGRMTEKSFSGYRWLCSFWLKHSPKQILAISTADAARFAALFPTTLVELMPNIKFAEVARQFESTKEISEEHHSAQPVIGFASVRQEEEALLLPLIQQLTQNSLSENTPRLVIAPRHMHRVDAWSNTLTQAGIPFTQRSQGEKGTSPVLIWDTFGELHTLYSSLDAVFVGGSLAPLGGQNFLEPLAHGLTPCIGPHWKNFHWVGTELFDLGLVHITDAESLLPTLLAHVEKNKKETTRRATRTAFQTWLAPRRHGAILAARAIRDLLSTQP